jgi:hypothetical protein
MCHLFHCEKGVADAICRDLGAATETAAQHEEKTQGTELEHGPESGAPPGATNTTAGAGTASPSPVRVQVPTPELSPALQKIVQDRAKIQVVKVLGAGQFGQVYLVNVAAENEGDEDMPRAVKKLRPGATPADSV